MTDDLSTSNQVDLATLQLDFEGFRRLSVNPSLSPNERIGFPDTYREGFGIPILRDIVAKLPSLGSEQGRIVLDIGPGCAELPQLLLSLCGHQAHQLYLMDSDEMLDQIDVEPIGVTKRPGMFPRDFAVLQDLVGRVDALLCYSVFHYIFVEANPFTFIDRCVELLAPGGRALIGDIPNVSKRRRFFSSDAGRRYHREFTKSDDLPQVEHMAAALLKIDDAVLSGMVDRAQAIGCNAYIVPQAHDLPMANRRDDLLLVKP